MNTRDVISIVTTATIIDQVNNKCFYHCATSSVAVISFKLSIDDLSLHSTHAFFDTYLVDSK